jgi:tetratricopeptide (TPR) repeat protein
MGAYWNTLPNDFVAGDRQFILRNPTLDNHQAVVQAFTSDYWEKLGGESFIYYRPIVILSHFIDANLYGLNPAGHHFSNMILHTIVTLLVYQLFLGLFASTPWCALFGSTLFALHPIHTHSVSYIMGRTDMLAALFFLWGLLLLIDTDLQKEGYWKTSKIIGACCCYFLALLSKEIAITLPLIFTLYWFSCSSKQASWKDPGFFVPFLSLSAILAVYLICKVMLVGIMPPGGALPDWYTIWQRGCLVFITCGFYVQKLFFPVRLCYYSNIVVPGLWEDILRSLLFWTGLGGGIVFLLSIRRNSRLGFALGWIGLTLLPVLNIIFLPHLAKENYLYLPSIGFCLLLSIAVKNGWGGEGTTRSTARPLLTLAIILVIFLYLGATLRRNRDYRDPEIFLESTLNTMASIPPQQREDKRYFEGVKNFYVTYKNLGILYQERKQWEKAVTAFEHALEHAPSYFSPHYAATVRIALGTVYEKMGRHREASTVLLQARPAAPHPSRVDNLLGVISIKQAQKDKAEFYFKRAIQEDTTYAPAHYNLGLLYMEIQEVEKGRKELREATRLNTRYKETLSRYAISSDEEGKTESTD